LNGSKRIGTGLAERKLPMSRVEKMRPTQICKFSVEIIRPLGEYLLTDKCENANYGSNVAGEMADLIARSYITALNALFNKGRALSTPTAIMMQANYSLTFGSGSNPTPFSVGMFAYIPNIGNEVTFQFGTIVVTGTYTTWVNCQLKFVFYYINNQLRLDYCTPAQALASSVTSVSLQVPNWYHFALTYDGTYLKFYINGIYNATNAITLSTTSLNVYAELSRNIENYIFQSNKSNSIHIKSLNK